MKDTQIRILVNDKEYFFNTAEEAILFLLIFGWKTGRNTISIQVNSDHPDIDKLVKALGNPVTIHLSQN